MALPKDFEMLKALRGRRDLDETDTSKDAEIAGMTPEEQVVETCAWYLGDGAWARKIAGWIIHAGATPAKVKETY